MANTSTAVVYSLITDDIKGKLTLAFVCILIICDIVLQLQFQSQYLPVDNAKSIPTRSVYCDKKINCISSFSQPCKIIIITVFERAKFSIIIPQQPFVFESMCLPEQVKGLTMGKCFISI